MELNTSQAAALRALQAALTLATDSGLFDEISTQVSNPDTVNRFCDDVETFAKAYGTPKTPITENQYIEILQHRVEFWLRGEGALPKWMSIRSATSLD